MRRFGRLSFSLERIFLIMVLLAGAVQAGDTGAEGEEIQFIGTLVNYTAGTMPGAPSYWMVQVDEVLLGPQPCDDPVKVVVRQSTPPPWGQVDPDLEEGDRVSVSGRYLTSGLGCLVTLQGSEDYYVMRYEEVARCRSLPPSFGPCKAEIDSIAAGNQRALSFGLSVFPWRSGVANNGFEVVKDKDLCCFENASMYDYELIGGGDQLGMALGTASAKNTVHVEGGSG